MANFVTVLSCAAIGAFFWGTTGFVIGLIIAILVLAGAANDKNKAKSASPKPITSAFTSRQHPVAAPKKTGPSAQQVHEYALCVANLYATILSFYPSNDSSKVNDVTGLLKSDDWITNKFVTLDELAGSLPQVQRERRDSPMLFQLHSNSHIERVLQLPKPMKDRLAMQLDGFLNGLGDADPKDCKDLIEQIREALRQDSHTSEALRGDSPTSSERLVVENFIMRSGNSEAINTLQKMRRSPRRYKAFLRSGARENTVLRTALGVFAGMVAVDAVRAELTNLQAHDLVNQLDHDIAKAGGIDNVSLRNEELNALESADPNNGAVSSFSGNTDAYSWESETQDVSPEEDVSHAIQADATDFNWDADTEAELDEVSDEDNDSDVFQEDETNAESGSRIYVADSSSDLAFDSED